MLRFQRDHDVRQTCIWRGILAEVNRLIIGPGKTEWKITIRCSEYQRHVGEDLTEQHGNNVFVNGTLMKQIPQSHTSRLGGAESRGHQDSSELLIRHDCWENGTFLDYQLFSSERLKMTNTLSFIPGAAPGSFNARTIKRMYKSKRKHRHVKHKSRTNSIIIFQTTIKRTH